VATEYPDHGIQLAQEAASGDYDLIAALGGDGTVHEVVNGVMRLPEGQRPLVGAVPIGSGNDFCSNAGVEQNLERAALRLYEGEPRRLDLGFVRDNTGHEEYFDNTLGIGFGAYVTLHSLQQTRLQGFSMYLYSVIQTIIRNHYSPRMRIETDQENIAMDVHYLVLCNGPREGGGFHVAPEATMDDGSFNYALIRRTSRLMFFRIIPEVMRGTHGRFKQVRMGEFRTLKLSADEPFGYHADGEILAGFASEVNEIEVRILPSALRVVI
jgi:YegS/Rv2252/BmrU family lipid kinase